MRSISILLGAIVIACLASCSQSQRRRMCDDIASSCDELGQARCSADRDAVEVCQADEEGCLLWTESESCGAASLCDNSTGAPTCRCNDECDREGDTRCTGRRLERCEEDRQGCLSWALDQDCGASGQGCSDSGSEAECVDGCGTECSPHEGERCRGTLIDGCSEDADGCWLWEEIDDCNDLDRSCEQDGDGARCVSLTCEDECDVEGESRCDVETIQTCQLVDGCFAWTDQRDCAAEGLNCMVSSDDEALCLCPNPCDPGLSRCAAGAVQECQNLGACWTWVETADCTDFDLPCDDSSGTAGCQAGSGDSCDEAMVVWSAPFTLSGADFTADFADDQTFTHGTCESRDRQAEAIFSVNAPEGSTIYIMENGGIDVTFSIQRDCDPDGPCELSLDDFPGDGLYYDVPAAGTYFIIIERSYREGSDYQIVIDLIQPEDCADGRDNDRDGAADCDDSDCFGTADCSVERNCRDGADNDGDGPIDCDDSDCLDSAGCEAFLGIYEQFDPSLDLDLAGTSLTFRPDRAAPMGYTWEAVTGVTDPPVVPGTGRTRTLELADDAFEEYAFAALPRFEFYGVSYRSAFISSNGFISFGEGNAAFAPTVEEFFARPTVAAMWTDLNPATGGRVIVDDFPDRLVVTFDGVVRYGASEPNDLQMILNADGSIEIHILTVSAPSRDRATFVGISSGVGIAPYPEETDFIRPADEICDDSIDNDGDGEIDCWDRDCSGDDACLEICDDDDDNDLDGQADCDDSDCFGRPPCDGAETNCADGADNDGDGAADCADSDCYDPWICDPFLGYWEGFERGNPPDVQGFAITFTPDASDPQGYSWSRARLPGGRLTFTPGTGSTTRTLSLPDDNFETYELAHMRGFTFYGVEYGNLFVGSNGYITFGEGSAANRTNQETFFALPGIYALLGDLNPAARGTVTLDELVDRLVVTFQDVPIFTRPPDPGAGGNDFQMILNSDGSIQLGYQSIAITDAMLGIGNGIGNGTYPAESNFVP